jgi:DNA-binding NarL/FixJ family response regulator
LHHHGCRYDTNVTVHEPVNEKFGDLSVICRAIPSLISTIALANRRNLLWLDSLVQSLRRGAIFFQRACRRGRSKPMSGEITVLLVDDHILVRRGLRRILEDDAGITVVGEARDGDEAVRMTRELRPRIVLMDCSMPGSNGVLATREIVASHPATAVLMLSMYPEDTWVVQALEAGARGYLLKGSDHPDLVTAIKRVAAGELVLDPRVPAPNGEKEDSVRQLLTERQLEVLQLIVEGKATKEIASQLGVSVNTVSTHRTNLMNILRLHNTAELVVYAVRHGLVYIR